MRILMFVLAFCSCAYTWLGCLAQWFAGPEISGSLPFDYIAFRTFAALITVFCMLALWKLTPAVIAIWLVALSYCLICWKIDADWVFRQTALYYIFWAPAFLTIAGVLERRSVRITS